MLCLRASQSDKKVRAQASLPRRRSRPQRSTLSFRLFYCNKIESCCNLGSYPRQKTLIFPCSVCCNKIERSCSRTLVSPAKKHCRARLVVRKKCERKRAYRGGAAAPSEASHTHAIYISVATFLKVFTIAPRGQKKVRASASLPRRQRRPQRSGTRKRPNFHQPQNLSEKSRKNVLTFTLQGVN